ncbi:copper oxidase [Streptomyces anthocyanicus]|uniref:Multicopper oxidase domain-containing protein n=1 Tax=Streptomyces rubrogriseus TaxID=194673 RepID=A0ABT4NZX3_9ACTN|nr:MULTISPECIES: multicopper oxidase domain-containing protein [Streptomyces anthocyanicus group]MCW8120613.1 multicopper oxidase domain-containing protein [Streptomyces anthocyanicus]MCZ4634684.1 multicopper oxidase domain-containing protein [Streptomyces rubrogriseus]WSB59629.1 multicopper oxidase domain-containing protein [Streptomyces anthocyanicus]WTC47337.1 multicopper oxidase domain-containing protein [Streptomyces anthocyanicus]GGL74162.1 copper oxidase [Streptomyces anthocyanicus]
MDRRGFNRRVLLGGAAAATSLSIAPEVAGAAPAAKGITARTAPAGGEVRHLKLYAEKLADGQMGYGFEKGKASVPGPLIEVNEGDTLHIEFTNTMDVRASLHVHGLDYEISSDGTAMNKSDVEPGGTRTYTWRTHKPGRRDDGTWRPGSAGYWHYHDHVVGTEHGTGGIRNGLYGPVIVRRKGDVLPDATHTIVFNDMTINNRKPHTGPDFEATVGDRVEIVMITHGEYYHTFHMHGHRWADNRTGILTGPDDPSRVIDNKITGPADSFGFQIIAGEGVGAGAWMYHCHVQSHSDMGMVGLFLVKKPDGTIPGYEPHEHGGATAKSGESGEPTGGAAAHEHEH